MKTETYTHAVLIDPFNRFVSNIMIKAEPDGLVGCKAMYEIINCDLVNCVQLDRKVDCWVDDEGLYRIDQAYFKIDGRFLAGKAIILSNNQDGDSVKATVDAAEVSGHVEWVDSEKGSVVANDLLGEGFIVTEWDIPA